MASTPARPGRIAPGLLLALGYVSMAASLSTDLYLPSFPELGRAFGVGPSLVQFTLTAFMIGIAVGNLLVGSVSDAVGRRPTLVFGLGLYALCAILAGLSPTIETLIVLRALQGVGAASGAVLARAIVSDLTEPKETARAFATLFVIIGLGPAIANPMGALLTEWGGWRAPLGALGAISAVMWVVAVLRIPESLPRAQRHPFKLRVLAKNLGLLLREPTFMGYTVAFGAGYAAMMVYISSSAFIAQEFYGLTPFLYSLTFALGSLSFVCGAWISGRFSARLGGETVLRRAQWLQLGCVVLALVLAFSGLLVLPVYVPMLMVFSAASGMLMPASSALAVGRAVGVAGAGSALVGFGQFVFGASSTPLGGLFGAGTIIPATVAMTGVALVSFVSARFAMRRARS